MQLNLLHVHSTAIGYGRLGVYLADELRKQGVTVHDHLPSPAEDMSAQRLDDHLNEGKSAGISNVACWVSVPTHARGWWKDQTACLFSMWEATVLPESFRETLHEFDTVIVPSLQNLELFGQYHDNVRFVPLGVDPDRWHYQPRQDPSPFFNFLIGGSGTRKGTDLAYRAFKTVFGEDGSWPNDGPIPRLIMKSPRGESDKPRHDRVTQVAGRIEDAEEVALYGAAHCYLQPSRGEGFGLQPLQAIAQGLPTILTDAHGHESFAHLGVGISAELAKSAYFIYGDAGDWWEPSFDELCEAMEDVYLRYDKHLERAEVSAETVAKEWTWADTTRKFLDAVGRDRLGPYEGRAEWYETQRRRYLVITNKDWTCDIAGITYHFKAGEEYWELADVKRILFEAGLLAPSCLHDYGKDGRADGTFDTGLTEEQAAKIDRYTAAHEHCPSCGQRLNSRPTKSDELFAEAEA